LWTREHSVRFVDQALGPGTIVNQQVGDHYCPNAGWLLAYASTTTTQPPAALDQTLNVQLDVVGPGQAGLNGTLVQGWSPGPVGLLYVPWPKLLVTVNTDAGLPGNATWRLSAMPVESSAEAAGLPSCVITETKITLAPNAEITVPLVAGATEWAVWADSATTMRVQPQDFAAAVVRGQWDVGAGPVAGGGTPAMGWQPTFRNGQVRIVDGTGAGLRSTFFLKFDFRTYGDSS
jgi:hypothetical protein